MLPSLSPVVGFRIGLMVVLLVAAGHVSIAARYAVHDVAKSERWRVLQDFEDGKNAALARLNPSGHQRLARPLQRLVPSAIPIASRYAVALRLVAAVCFALSLVAFFTLAARGFGNGIAFLTWLGFVGVLGRFAPIGFIGTGESLALLLVLAAYGASLVFRRYLYVAAVLVGLAFWVAGDGRMHTVPTFMAMILGLFIAGGIMEHLSELEDPRWRWLAFGAVVLLAGRFVWHPGQFQNAEYLRTREVLLRESRRSTFDAVAEHLRRRVDGSMVPLVAQWGVPLPDDFPVTYRMPDGVTAESAAFLRDLSLKVREGTPLQILREEKAPWVVTLVDLRKAPGFECATLEREFGPEVVVPTHRFYPQAWLSFRQAWRDLVAMPVTRVPASAGPTVFLFDTRACR